jgi:hypothetical protein
MTEREGSNSILNLSDARINADLLRPVSGGISLWAFPVQ